MGSGKQQKSKTPKYTHSVGCVFMGLTFEVICENVKDDLHPFRLGGKSWRLVFCCVFIK